MRIQSISVLFALLAACAVGFAWWYSYMKRRQPKDLRRDGVMGKATLTAVTPGEAGRLNIAYTYRHPFTGEVFSRVGTVDAGLPTPQVGDTADIVFIADQPERSRLVAELGAASAEPGATG